MKQVTQNVKTGEVALLDVPVPQVGAGEVLVSTQASLISAGTEKMIMDFANKSMLGKAKERPDLVKKVIDKLSRDGIGPTIASVFAQLEEPLPLGYSAAGEVIAVGADLSGIYNKGDRVAIAGAGLANHAEINAVPKNLVVPLPKEVAYTEGAFATLASIAMHGVRNGRVQLGDRVLVMGLGLVGQLAVQLAAAAGARVSAVDFDDGRLKLAEQEGAQFTYNLSGGGADSALREASDGRGFDVILVCAATESNEPIHNAAKWARDKARIVLVGKVGTTIPYADYMKKELEFIISRSYGPGRYDANYEGKGQGYPIGYVPWTERDNLLEAVRLMADGKLNVAPLITHSYDIHNATEAYGVVGAADIPKLGVVLTYDNATDKRTVSKIDAHTASKAITADQVGLSYIGAGGFAKSLLMPATKACETVKHIGVVSKGGLSAKAAADKFNFVYASSSADEVFTDVETHAVIVATRHNTHADLVIKALNAGKHVFVEKPLAMNFAELSKIEAAQKKAGTTQVMVGYNRRFSPHTQKLKTAFSRVDGPKQVIIRANVGQLPDDNWQNDAKTGGGRLVGELCHFLDLAYHLIGKRPKNVFTARSEGQDVFTTVMTFENGHMATIVYTSEGDTAFSKERVEIFGGGMVGVIDNFRKTTLSNNGRVSTLHGGKFAGTDKGHKVGLTAFIKGCRDGERVMSADDVFISAALPLLAAKSIQNGGVIQL